MRTDAAVQIFEDVGAIRHGHFELTSGLHSAMYVQCALVLQYPKYAEQLGRALPRRATAAARDEARRYGFLRERFCAGQ